MSTDTHSQPSAFDAWMVTVELDPTARGER